MADKFRTQDVPVTGHVSYMLTMPNALWFVQEWLDLMRDMVETANWEEVGTVTVDEATQAAEIAYWSIDTMVGSIIAYITVDPPSNALACDGATYLREDYPTLYGALDSAFITDADHFIVPDLRGRTVIGAGLGTGLTPRAMNASGGEETHVLSGGEMPVHSHLDSGHIHSIHSHIVLPVLAPGELPVCCPNPLPEATSGGNAAIGNAGSGNAHNTMPPFVALKYGVIAW